MVDAGVIGVGRLGAALARSLGRAGLRVTAVAGRRSEPASALAAELGGSSAGVTACSPAELLARADLVFLAVPDGALAGLCSGLPWGPRHAAVHTAGALDLSVLVPAQARGARVGAFHPVQSFAAQSGPAAFAGIHVGIEASEPVLASALEALCRALSATPLSLAGIDRAGYHAAAVFASNYVVALHVAAAQAFELAGLSAEQARSVLAPLTMGTARNLREQPLAAALTGPVARGDVESVRRHLAVLEAHPPLARLYRALGAQLLRLPLELGSDTRLALAAELPER
jgi:predicted short-subunit dehydrogenase-like oxidoreductase (DUF2520 family)